MKAALSVADPPAREVAVLAAITNDARSAFAPVQDDGTLPLHMACKKRGCTGHTIAALLAANPQAASTANVEGLLPLHISAANRAAPEVLAQLLKAHPDAAREMDSTSYRTPLHYASVRSKNLEGIKQLLAAYPAAAGIADGDGRTPAELATLHGAGAEAVALLTDALATAVAQRGPTQPRRHFNVKLRANNVWEVALPPEPLAEALCIFQRCGLRHAFEELRSSTMRHRRLELPAGEPEKFFAVRAGGFSTSTSDERAGVDVAATGGGGECAAASEYTSWSSDVTWISVDDEPTHAQFEAIFRGCGLEAQFERICGCEVGLRMYSASYVVRSRCTGAKPSCPCFACPISSRFPSTSARPVSSHAHVSPSSSSSSSASSHSSSSSLPLPLRSAAPNFHYDYIDGVDARALTLIAPLKQYQRPQQALPPTSDSADGSFQLIYEEATPDGGDAGATDRGEASAEEEEEHAMQMLETAQACGPRRRIRRHDYQFGKAVVFGAGFRHSTEPGGSMEPDGEPHVYLCFTFGTDRQEHWPLIAQTIDGDQSRLLCRPDGETVLTQLGRTLRVE